MQPYPIHIIKPPVLRRPPGLSVRPLPRRAYECAILAAQGWSNKAIARELGISLQTAKNHLMAAQRVYGFKSRTQLAVWFCMLGLVDYRGEFTWPD